MSNRTPPPSRPAFDALEFEVTDFGEARQALDELPPGIAELAQRASGNWAERRRPPKPSDRALTGAAVDWVMSLPPGLRPQKLSMQYPRVANQIAEIWADTRAVRMALEELLLDRRGGRRGLPDAAQAEVRALIDHINQRGHGHGPAVSAEELLRARRLLESAGYRVIPPGG
jgi:hypothetical protein